MRSKFEEVVESAVTARQPEGAAFDPGMIIQIMTAILQIIQQCPFSKAKKAMKEGGSMARVAVYNAIKESGYEGNAVELTEDLVAQGKQAQEEDMDEIIEMAESLDVSPISRGILFGFMLTAAVMFSSVAQAGGPFPLAAATPSGPFPVALEEASSTPFPVVDVEATAGQQDVQPDPVAAVDNRPVLEVLTADGDWCEYCNQWKRRGDEGLPFQLDFVEVDERPRFGYPTFRVPHSDGREWFIGNPGASDAGAAALVKSWRRITGIEEDVTSAGEQPTPQSEVERILVHLQPKADEVFVDYGCGDGRWCITAAKKYGCDAVGIEIDPDKVAEARRKVKAAGLEDKVQIIEGDVREVEVEADVGVAYLYPDLLDQIRPKITQLKRFASYRHNISGLQTAKAGDAYIWRDEPIYAAAQPTRRTGPVAYWGGRQYTRRVCSSPRCNMCNSIQRQLSR